MLKREIEILASLNDSVCACMFVCVCVRVCVRACVRACVCVCVMRTRCVKAKQSSGR